MDTITIDEMKGQLANRYNIEIKKVCCYYCAKWGYNNYKPMSDTGKSKCANFKSNTYCNQFCKKFEYKG